jgi:hypothetical protein
MIMLQAFAPDNEIITVPDNKIITDFGYNTMTRRDFISKSFTIPSITRSPKN